MLHSAVKFILFLIRHLNLSATLPTHKATAFHAHVHQDMELKQVSPEISNAFPRLVKAVHTAQDSSES